MSRGFSELTALIIDDSRSVRQIFGDNLRQFGVRQIQLAADGAEALKLIDGQDGGFDLIFCDLNMPGMNGIQAIREFSVRELKSRIIIFSSLDQALMRNVSDYAQRLGLQVGGLLSKPVGLPAVESILRQAVDDRLATASNVVEPLTCSQLKDALDEKRIEVYYQPQIELENGKVVGVEALARVRDPMRGLVLPDDFVPAAEIEPELMSRLTEVVIEKSLACSRQWRDAGLELEIAFTLSTLGLRDRELPQYLNDALTQHQLPVGSVTLEIKESRAANLQTFQDTVSSLISAGFTLAVDNFGPSASSLNALHDLQFSQVKLDRQLVRGTANDPHVQTLLQSIVDSGKKMNLEMVAEGVEHLDDWTVLTKMGFSRIQGNLASRPIPAEQIPDFIKMWSVAA